MGKISHKISLNLISHFSYLIFNNINVLTEVELRILRALVLISII